MNTQNSLQLELHVPDFETVKDFYEVLGFKVVWEREPEDDKGYLILRNECGCILNFWSGNEAIYNQSYFKQFPKNSKRGFGVEIVISSRQDLAELQSTLEKNGTIITERLQHRPWGLDDFRIEDPFGFYLRITTEHDVTNPENAVK